VSEGLHAHHQFRWAQLSCAVVGDVKLEDRGEGREVLFRLRRGGRPGQDGGVPAAGRTEADAPAAALRAWRDAAAGTNPAPGVAPVGYGAGGAVGPLLEPRANAARPDPYAVIGDAQVLAEVANAYGLPPPRLREVLPRLDALARRDPGNPAVPFWRGRYLRRLDDLRGAAEAFDRALELGRVDADTLWLAMGMRADLGERSVALERLGAFGAAVAPDVRVLCLASRLWREEGDAQKADDHARRAREAVRGPRDLERLEQGGCR
jgi:tetratricopeptide (TPR) repeat protein